MLVEKFPPPKVDVECVKNDYLAEKTVLKGSLIMPANRVSSSRLARTSQLPVFQPD